MFHNFVGLTSRSSKLKSGKMSISDYSINQIRCRQNFFFLQYLFLSPFYLGHELDYTTLQKKRGFRRAGCLAKSVGNQGLFQHALTRGVVKGYAKKCCDTFDFSDSNHKLVTPLFFLLDVLQSSSKLYIASLFPPSSKQSQICVSFFLCGGCQCFNFCYRFIICTRYLSIFLCQMIPQFDYFQVFQC